MKPNIRVKTLRFLFVGVFFLSAGAGAQQNASTSFERSRAYDLRREVSLQGTVAEYKPFSPIPPLGAHVNLQTSSGMVDVHLGNPQMLTANHLSLAPGDTVRVIGESLNGIEGTQFVARILQKGAQVIAVRSLQGIPLKPGRASASRAPAQKQQGGVL